MPNLLRQNRADCDSDNPESTPEYVSSSHRRQHLEKKKGVVRGEAHESTNTYLKPSPPRKRSPDSQASSVPGPSTSHYSPKIDQWTKDSFEQHSNLPASVPPTAKIRGTEQLMTSHFTGEQLAEIQDPELFQDLPLLLPPPQPVDEETTGDYGPRAFWGLHSEPQWFFSADEDLERETPVPVDPQIQAKLERFHELKHKGVHYNETLMQNRSFKNPNVLSQLVNFLGIDETRSNLPCVDTGRDEGSWRSKFPLSDLQLLDGNPVAIVAQQREEAELERKSRQQHKNADRKIEFGRGRYDADAQRPSKRRASAGISKSRPA